MDAALLPADVKDLDFDEELYYGEEIMQKDTNEDIAYYSDSSIRCEYWLRAYNDYTYIWASSTAYGGLMDTITTICTAYYESGKRIDEVVNSISGNVQNSSAVVEVPKTPLNLKAAYAVSSHSFYKEGYIPVQGVASWQRPK
ncbi:MAG: hypothetical protein K2N87_03595 [Eubacterium sp.]|nr:hypothetical protein [Eubacterium sp.]